MPSETDCLNDALGQIGAAAITSISDGSKNANHCLRFYPALRDGLLRSHHWNFAMTWVALAQDVTAPVAEFAYAYTLPPESLKVVNYGGSLPSTTTSSIVYSDPSVRALLRYKIEGRKLLSNDGIAYIQYIRRITNPDEWDAIFYQAVTTWLASKLANAIPKDAKMSLSLLKQATDIIMPLALAVDGQEGSVEAYVVDDLIWGR